MIKEVLLGVPFFAQGKVFWQFAILSLGVWLEHNNRILEGLRDLVMFFWKG